MYVKWINKYSVEEAPTNFKHISNFNKNIEEMNKYGYYSLDTSNKNLYPGYTCMCFENDSVNKKVIRAYELKSLEFCRNKKLEELKSENNKLKQSPIVIDDYESPICFNLQYLMKDSYKEKTINEEIYYTCVDIKGKTTTLDYYHFNILKDSVLSRILKLDNEMKKIVSFINKIDDCEQIIHLTYEDCLY